MNDNLCRDCGRRYSAEETEMWRCECGAPLEIDYIPEFGGKPSIDEIDMRAGLWAFEYLIPAEREVSLGEGFTPIVPDQKMNTEYKLEYVFPSGSFKDRGATTTLSRAKSLGVDKIVEDSSGNAGAAIAQYAAKAGIDADIYVPASAKESKLKAIERVGANVVKVEGSRQDVTDECVEAAESGRAWYASHAWNPAFLAGTMTFGFEVAVQRDWELPDVVVLPVGHGTLFLGTYRGFETLVEAGWIDEDEIPRLLGAQAKGCAPIAEEVRDEEGNEETNQLADGIQIRNPARKEEILEAINETDGDVVAVSEGKTRESLKELHESGFYVEPTCAVQRAAVELYRDEGVIGEESEVLVPLTGSGLKS